MLRAALKKRSNGGDSVDLRIADVKIDYFKLQPHEWVGRLGRLPGNQMFTGSAEPRYQAVSASISRAIVRLERRGLVTVHVAAWSRWTGFKLTDAGAAIAKTLSVTSAATPSADPEALSVTSAATPSATPSVEGLSATSIQTIASDVTDT
jgi:hypothetical protein